MWHSKISAHQCGAPEPVPPAQRRARPVSDAPDARPSRPPCSPRPPAPPCGGPPPDPRPPGPGPASFGPRPAAGAPRRRARARPRPSTTAAPRSTSLPIPRRGRWAPRAAPAPAPPPTPPSARDRARPRAPLPASSRPRAPSSPRPTQRAPPPPLPSVPPSEPLQRLNQLVEEKHLSHDDISAFVHSPPMVRGRAGRRCASPHRPHHRRAPPCAARAAPASGLHRRRQAPRREPSLPNLRRSPQKAGILDTLFCPETRAQIDGDPELRKTVEAAVKSFDSTLSEVGGVGGGPGGVGGARSSTPASRSPCARPTPIANLPASYLRSSPPPATPPAPPQPHPHPHPHPHPQDDIAYLARLMKHVNKHSAVSGPAGGLGRGARGRGRVPLTQSRACAMRRAVRGQTRPPRHDLPGINVLTPPAVSALPIPAPSPLTPLTRPRGRTCSRASTARRRPARRSCSPRRAASGRRSASIGA
jgi:hypothetical protein